MTSFQNKKTNHTIYDVDGSYLRWGLKVQMGVPFRCTRSINFDLFIPCLQANISKFGLLKKDVLYSNS